MSESKNGFEDSEDDDWIDDDDDDDDDFDIGGSNADGLTRYENRLPAAGGADGKESLPLMSNREIVQSMALFVAGLVAFTLAARSIENALFGTNHDNPPATKKSDSPAPFPPKRDISRDTPW